MCRRWSICVMLMGMLPLLYTLLMDHAAPPTGDAALPCLQMVEEMAEGAMDFNVPLFKENRELVASMNGGLYDPSVLVFNSSWNNNGTTTGCEKFSYPVISGIKRPNKDEYSLHDCTRAGRANEVQTNYFCGAY